MIKIGMTGAQGTGKTSMAEAMQRVAFRNFALVPSTARQIKEYGYPINRDATELSQLLVPLLRMTDEAEATTDSHNRLYKQGIISDRTLIDSLAYTMYQNSHIWEGGDFVENITFRLTQMYMPTYNVLLYFPIYWDNVGDGVRDPDEAYRREIDLNVKTILEALGVEYWTVPNVSPEERSAWLVDKFDQAYQDEARYWKELFQGRQ